MDEPGPGDAAEEAGRPGPPTPTGYLTPLAAGVEFDLIRVFVDAAGASASLRVPPGDDAAALEVPAGESLVLTVDAAVEGVHFRREWLSWESVGYRAAAAALSDVAAMAARPLGVLVSLLLPPELERDVVVSLGRGLGECLRAHETPLLGGNVSRSPGPVALDVTAAGSTSRPVPRSGARPGDELWVTGSLGGAACALWHLSRYLEPAPACRRRFERPSPRLREAAWLAERAEVHACIDLSDGLGGDARHLAAASGVRLEVEVEALPLAEALRGYADRKTALRLALSGGEDYELLLAAAPGSVGAVCRRFEEELGTSLTRVGGVHEGSGVAWLDAGGRRLPEEPGGYGHFGSREGGAAGRGQGDPRPDATGATGGGA